MMNTEAAYWMALAHELPVWSFSDKDDWKNEDKMNLIIRFHHEKRMSIADLSAFHPQAPWGKELAMARNAIIYGLANEIYVAESKPSKNRQGKETKGGTYAGVMDGLKKGRTIYVRKPAASENNDNHFLIQSGAEAVGFDGQRFDYSEVEEGYALAACEPQPVYTFARFI